MNQPAPPDIGDISPAIILIAGLIGGGMGFLCGKIPMAYASERRRDGLGLAAMITCVFCGFLGGCVFGLPAAMVWTIIIVCAGHAPDDRVGSGRRDVYKPWVPPAAAAGPALPGPYSQIGPVVVCNECQHAHTPGREGIPEACPACGNDFRTKAAEIPVVEPAAAAGTALPAKPEPRRKLVSWREERRRGSAPRGERAVSARRRVAMAREEALPPPPAKDQDEVIELRPPSDDPRGW